MKADIKVAPTFASLLFVLTHCPQRALIAVGGGANEFAVTTPPAPVHAGWNGFAIVRRGMLLSVDRS